MPSHGLIRQFGDLVAVEEEWWWNGTHYRRTAEHWLENLQRNAVAVDRRPAAMFTVLTPRSGIAAGVCSCYATAGLFGHSGGPGMGRQSLSAQARVLIAGLIASSAYHPAAPPPQEAAIRATGVAAAAAAAVAIAP